MAAARLARLDAPQKTNRGPAPCVCPSAHQPWPGCCSATMMSALPTGPRIQAVKEMHGARPLTRTARSVSVSQAVAVCAHFARHTGGRANVQMQMKMMHRSRSATAAVNAPATHNKCQAATSPEGQQDRKQTTRMSAPTVQGMRLPRGMRVTRDPSTHPPQVFELPPLNPLCLHSRVPNGYDAGHTAV